MEGQIFPETHKGRRTVFSLRAACVLGMAYAQSINSRVPVERALRIAHLAFGQLETQLELNPIATRFVGLDPTIEEREDFILGDCRGSDWAGPTNFVFVPNSAPAIASPLEDGEDRPTVYFAPSLGELQKMVSHDWFSGWLLHLSSFAMKVALAAGGPVITYTVVAEGA